MCVCVSAAGFVILTVLFVRARPIFVIFAVFSVHARLILVIFAVFFVRVQPILVTLVRKTADFCPDARVRLGFGD